MIATLPELRWGSTPDSHIHAPVSWCGNHTKGPKRPRVGKAAALRTPREFLQVLRAIAEGAQARPGDER